MPIKLRFKSHDLTETGLKKFLGELELAVMEVIWQQGQSRVAEVVAALQRSNRNLAYTTVMTILRRLTEKGWLSASKAGRAYVYTAVYGRDAAQAAAVGEVVRALLRDFGEVAVAQFVKELDEIDPEQLAKLARLTEEDEVADDPV